MVDMMMMMNKKGMISNLIGGFVAIGILIMVFGLVTDEVNTLMDECDTNNSLAVNSSFFSNSSVNCEILSQNSVARVAMDNRYLVLAGMILPFLFMFGRGFISLIRGVLEGIEEFITDLAQKEDNNKEKSLKESKPKLKVRSKPFDFELHKAARKYYESKIKRESESESKSESKPVKKTIKDSGVDWGKGMESYEEMKGDDKKDEGD